MSLIETGDGKALPTVVRNEHGDRTRTWRTSGAAGPACGSCGCDLFPYEPEGEGLAFDFRPACWSMRGEDRTRGESFNVGKSLEKSMRDLPPGMSMSLDLAGKQLPLGPPRSPDSTGGDGEALESFRTAARRPVEIGRQVWMGRMTFEGMNDVARDHGEARLWFEMAGRFGHVEAFGNAGIDGGGRPVAGPAPAPSFPPLREARLEEGDVLGVEVRGGVLHGGPRRA